MKRPTRATATRLAGWAASSCVAATIAATQGAAIEDYATAHPDAGLQLLWQIVLHFGGGIFLTCWVAYLTEHWIETRTARDATETRELTTALHALQATLTAARTPGRTKP